MKSKGDVMPAPTGAARPNMQFRRIGNSSHTSVRGSFVIGEHGRETTIDVRRSTEDIRAQLEAYAADRRRRGISPAGTLFEGEDL